MLYKTPRKELFIKCYICDATLANPSFNRDHGDINPCPTCQAVINDVFGSEPEPELTDGEIEPTAEEMLADSEELAYGRSFE